MSLGFLMLETPTVTLRGGEIHHRQAGRLPNRLIEADIRHFADKYNFPAKLYKSLNNGVIYAKLVARPGKGV